MAWYSIKYMALIRYSVNPHPGPPYVMAWFVLYIIQKVCNVDFTSIRAYTNNGMLKDAVNIHVYVQSLILLDWL